MRWQDPGDQMIQKMVGNHDPGVNTPGGLQARKNLSLKVSIRMKDNKLSLPRIQTSRSLAVQWKSLIAFLGMTVSDVFIACGRMFQYFNVYSDIFLRGRCTVFDGENEGKSSTETSFWPGGERSNTSLSVHSSYGYSGWDVKWRAEDTETNSSSSSDCKLVVL